MKFVHVKDVAGLAETASPPFDDLGTNISHGEIGGVDIEFPMRHPQMHLPRSQKHRRRNTCVIYTIKTLVHRHETCQLCRRDGINDKGADRLGESSIWRAFRMNFTPAEPEWLDVNLGQMIHDR
jgi:hypothetical protein